MLRAAKIWFKRCLICASALPLCACASLFSAYDSDFSCKNSDHGGCAHPLEAYEQARAEEAPTFAAAPGLAASGGADKHLEHDSHDLGRVAQSNDYQSYQDVSYSELGALIGAPQTPVLAPAKTVRTLILPYTDPNSSEHLYMPRYVYSVLENARFVLGNYLLQPGSGLTLEALFGSKAASDDEAQE